jgi:hypothetical protein
MNILSTIRDMISPELLGQISNAVGESPESTRSALEQSMPALLGSAVSEASSPQGATNLFKLLKDKAPQGGWSTSASSLLGSLMGGGGGIGSSVISALLGSKAGMLQNFISRGAGIRPESASSLLGMGGHMLMGTLGKQVADQGLGASTFGQLLRSQIPHLQGALSPELAGMLGLGNLLTGAKAAVPSASQAYGQPAGARPELAGAGRGLKWAAVALAVLAGAILLAHRYGNQTNVGGTRDENATTHGMGAGMPTNIQLPHINTADFTDRVKTAIASSDGTPIDLPSVNFDNAGDLSASAKNTLSLVGNALTGSPSVKANITAYGKTMEEAASRANAIKSVLVSAGISADRLNTQTEVGEGIPKVSFTK